MEGLTVAATFFRARFTYIIVAMTPASRSGGTPSFGENIPFWIFSVIAGGASCPNFWNPI